MKTGLIAAACGLALLATASNAQVPVNIAKKVRAAGQAMDPTIGRLYAPMFPKEAWAGVDIQRDIAYGADPLQKLDVSAIVVTNSHEVYRRGALVRRPSTC